MDGRIYAAIDLKSFYASVECVERGLDPLRANLVVADKSRTDKTICLAVSPPLKARGISGRARLFEVVQRVREINRERERLAPERRLEGSSWDDDALKANPALAVDYVVAPPRMALYVRRSTEIYQIYLRHVAPEHIHVYSIDEVFMDVTDYLHGRTPREFVKLLMDEVLVETGITATAGIGTNLYLAKVAMDVRAKHIPADANGARIAELDEESYRRTLWTHQPLTDFWRVGRGYARKLERCGLYTMGDVARCSLGGPGNFHNEELLYKLFGISAELLIDHAWGWEPCTLADIRAYRPEASSTGAGQVLTQPYEWEKARVVVREMADALAMDLLRKGLVTDQVVLTVNYDTENLTDPARAARYRGPVVTDWYGRQVPKHAHGTANLPGFTASAKRITDAVMALYDRVTDHSLLVRRLNLTACHVVDEDAPAEQRGEQLDLFSMLEGETRDEAAEERERQCQLALLHIREKYGKNAILKGTSYTEGATARERNQQIGGHKA